MRKSRSLLNFHGATINNAEEECRPVRDVYGAEHEVHSILLPNQSDFIHHVALDIGGSLIKMVFFETVGREGGRGRAASGGSAVTREEDDDEAGRKRQGSHPPLVSLHYRRELDVPQPAQGSVIRFVKFPTARIDQCIDFILEHNLLVPGETQVQVCGGGAHKYAGRLRERLGMAVSKQDEMVCMIHGLLFLLRSIPNESFTYHHGAEVPRAFGSSELRRRPVFPFLVVSIGSGVSILLVESERVFRRVDGSSIGGGTFWGLCSVLTGAHDFHNMLEMAKSGDNERIDLTVGDIYGGAYDRMGLPESTLASSFGKVLHSPAPPAGTPPELRTEDDPPPSPREGTPPVSASPVSALLEGLSSSQTPSAALSYDMRAAVAASVLRMVSMNIAQIAYLNACRFNVSHIYFSGSFIRNNPLTMARISYGVHYWSKGLTQARYLLHEGYVGAMGAMLFNDDISFRSSSEDR